MVFAEFPVRLDTQKHDARAPTGLVEEKKSMSFPIANGMLIDTEDETRSNPMAVMRGLRSGFAKASIFWNDDALAGSLEKIAGRNLDIRDRAGFCGGAAFD